MSVGAVRDRDVERSDALFVGQGSDSAPAFSSKRRDFAIAAQRRPGKRGRAVFVARIDVGLLAQERRHRRRGPRSEPP